MIVRARRHLLLTFQMVGEMVGKQRARFSGVRSQDGPRGRKGSPIMRTAPKTILAEEAIRNLALAAAQKQHLQKATGDLRLEIVVFCSIPTSYAEAKQRSCELGLLRPHVTPDGDNIFKLVADAFNRYVYDDDKRVVEGEFVKWYVPDRTIEPYSTVELFQCVSLAPAPRAAIHRKVEEALDRWPRLTKPDQQKLLEEHLGLFLDLQDLLIPPLPTNR